MAPRKKSTAKVPPKVGAAGSAEAGRPVPRKAPKMRKRVVHNDRVYEVGDPCPVIGKDLERWQRIGLADNG